MNGESLLCRYFEQLGPPPKGKGRELTGLDMTKLAAHIKFCTDQIAKASQDFQEDQPLTPSSIPPHLLSPSDLPLHLCLRPTCTSRMPSARLLTTRPRRPQGKR